MNTLIASGILIELVIAAGGIYLIRQLQKKKKRQPGLSNKIIKNLKF
tara:strand:+ start:405 stop:545 length:141 start_codon:yes stop_codon:yes gene_type:complete